MPRSNGGGWTWTWCNHEGWDPEAIASCTKETDHIHMYAYSTWCDTGWMIAPAQLIDLAPYSYMYIDALGTFQDAGNNGSLIQGVVIGSSLSTSYSSWLGQYVSDETSARTLYYPRYVLNSATVSDGESFREFGQGGEVRNIYKYDISMHTTALHPRIMCVACYGNIVDLYIYRVWLEP